MIDEIEEQCKTKGYKVAHKHIAAAVEECDNQTEATAMLSATLQIASRLLAGIDKDLKKGILSLLIEETESVNIEFRTDHQPAPESPIEP